MHLTYPVNLQLAFQRLQSTRERERKIGAHEQRWPHTVETRESTTTLTSDALRQGLWSRSWAIKKYNSVRGTKAMRVGRALALSVDGRKENTGSSLPHVETENR